MVSACKDLFFFGGGGGKGRGSDGGIISDFPPPTMFLTGLVLVKAVNFFSLN